MSLTAPPPAELCNEHVSIVRLHGEACFYCGAALGRLRPAGSNTTPVPGGTREWLLVACDEHRRGSTR
ncbi:hypothetical protein RM572_02070 [Streptomyces sp. DSM 42041]|uniref:HNH endonuclease n=1 Tax=Streptomyces hazeniae TaxID=3075538 RepID=A0ABU2NKP4_9ACTN|nr:hypothetical protein [Streptomyces sp. DSM 42041]MDT0377561.1 hypothetical protein [Streptomyces sp. DSM 42041]